MSLFWRICLLNAVVLGAATALLLFTPVTVSVPVRPAEALIVVGGLAAVLIANGVLLRVGLAPLDRLIRVMTTADLLRPAPRMDVAGPRETASLITTFNSMLHRLEAERSESSARALSAQEAERRRIAQELHDEVGQTFTAVLLELKRAADHSPPDVREELLQAQEATREGLDEIRRIARRLRPGVLEELGLVSALRELTSEIPARSGLSVRHRFDHDLLRLDPEAELVVYRVAQESITNTVRHARAGHLDFALTRSAAGVDLCIRDDGRGIGRAREGAGIRGMRERALLVGGDLSLGPGPHGGTEVRLRVPARRRESERMTEQREARVLLADDHALVRRGVRLILDGEPGLAVVAEASDGAEAIDLARACQPDLAILDIAMPRLTGLQAARELSRLQPGLRILVLTMYDNEQYFFEALRAGASGYVLKSVADRDLVEACHAAMRGEPFLYPGAVSALIRSYLDRVRSGEPVPDRAITDREEEILKLVAEGHSSREIARMLVISAKTVERHRANLLSKLGLKDRLELTRYAIRAGLIEP